MATPPAHLVHGFGPTTAGVSLTTTGLMWALGLWLQGHHGQRFAPATILRVGLAIMAAGLAATSLLAWTALPPYLGLAGSDRTSQGRNSSAAQVASSLSTATALAINGTAVAFAAPAPGRLVFGAILTGGAAVALFGALVSGRVIHGSGG